MKNFRHAVLATAALVVLASAVRPSPAMGSGPLSHWSFDETSGSIAFDTGSAGHDGILAGGAVFAPGAGISGGAIFFDQAASSYVTMGDVLGPTEISGGVFSISAWIRTSRPGSDNQVYVGKHKAGFLNGYQLSANFNAGTGGTAGHAWFYVSNPPGNLPISTSVVNDDVWHHVVGVYDPAGSNLVTIYVDGAPAEASVAPSTHVDNTVPFMVGGHCDSDGDPVGIFHGWIDEVSVWAGALTAGEVDALFHEYVLFRDGFEGGNVCSWSEAAGAPACS
ncbi:MAG: LamG domain-containing protein [Thermoanaerobaculia bacterium]